MSKPLPRSPTSPTPGFYVLKLVRGAWRCPCRLTLTDGAYSCEIDGEAIPGSFDEATLQEMFADWLVGKAVSPIIKLILYGQPCDEAECAWRNATREHNRVHNPDHPSVNPTKPINRRLLSADNF